jgi:hypothetical protein
VLEHCLASQPESDEDLEIEVHKGSSDLCLDLIGSRKAGGKLEVKDSQVHLVQKLVEIMGHRGQVYGRTGRRKYRSEVMFRMTNLCFLGPN